METSNQAKLAYELMNANSRLSIPVGIYWDTQINLLVNCEEHPKRKNTLIATTNKSIRIQFIRLNSNGKACRYWGQPLCNVGSIKEVNESIQLQITEHLGIKNHRHRFLNKVFMGGNQFDKEWTFNDDVKPATREMGSHQLSLFEDLSFDTNDKDYLFNTNMQDGVLN